jgi:hypothetical protein
MARIVDSVLVDEDGADQSTELDECVPVAAVAGETRSLDRKHRTDTTVTDCGQQSLKAWTGDAAARSSEIVIDDLDSRPAKLFGRPIRRATARRSPSRVASRLAPSRPSRRGCRPLASARGRYSGPSPRAAERIGLKGADFGAHSLRAGFLTSAARRGASVFKTRDVSRHKSMDVLQA